jgi:hypothetical protein
MLLDLGRDDVLAWHRTRAAPTALEAQQYFFCLRAQLSVGMVTSHREGAALAHSEQEQLERVRNLFDGKPTDRGWVLAQSSEFNPADRRKRVPEASFWPPELDECPGSDVRRRVDRATVFSIAARAAESGDESAALQLHVAVVIWGTETSAQSAVRALRPLKEPTAGQNFKGAMAKVRSQEPSSVYRSMTQGGFFKTKGLEASYFTKFMYFAGFGAHPYITPPLIYDQHVARAMSDVTGELWVPGERSADRYGEYVEMASNWARELDIEGSDVVERRLFHHGQNLKRDP